MNLKIIKTISFKEKKHLVKEACAMYKKLKIQFNKFSNDVFYLNDNNVKHNKNHIKSISIFKNIIVSMNSIEKLILKNDFLNETKKKEWYSKLFSKTTYYKLKHQTVDKFLFYLYG